MIAKEDCTYSTLYRVKRPRKGDMKSILGRSMSAQTEIASPGKKGGGGGGIGWWPNSKLAVLVFVCRIMMERVHLSQTEAAILRSLSR